MVHRPLQNKLVLEKQTGMRLAVVTLGTSAWERSTGRSARTFIEQQDTSGLSRKEAPMLMEQRDL